MLTSREKNLPSEKIDRAKILYGFLKNYNSLNTQLAYKEDLGQFLKFLLHQFKITEFRIEHAHCVAFKNYLIERKYSHSSINRKLASVSAYIEYLMIEGLRSENPFRRIRRFKEDSIGKTVAIPVPELMDAVSRIDRTTLTGKFRYALLSVFFNTGIRVSALCNLRLGNLSIDENGVFIRALDKGDKDFKVYLSEQTMLALKDYLRGREEKFGELSREAYLFQSFSKNAATGLHRTSVNYIFESVFENLSVFGVSPHSARATFITEVIKREGLSNAQARANHSSPITTQKYNRHIESVKPFRII